MPAANMFSWNAARSAIEQHRITGLDFNGGIFTNITHDHLDYHLTSLIITEGEKEIL